MIQIIKWCFYIAIILLLVGAIKYLFSERNDAVDSVREISQKLNDSATRFISNSEENLDNLGRNFDESINSAVKIYAKEVSE